MPYDWLDKYLMRKKGTTWDFKEEWQWKRYQVGGKLYAAVCKGESGQDELITFKLEPLEGELLRKEYPDIIPGYYMNKTHWSSIKINGAAPDEVVRRMADESYRLVLGGLTKKQRAEITGGTEG